MSDRTKKEELTWDLSHLFEGDDDKAIEKERKKVKEEVTKFSEKWEDRDDYLSDPEVMKEALDDYEYLNRKFGASGSQAFYFQLRRAQDQSDPELKAKLNKVVEFHNQMKNKIRFFGMKISKIPKEDQDKFLESENLEPYKNFLKNKFRQAEYLLSEPEEKIIDLKREPAYSNWMSMRSDFISREERTVLTEEKKEEEKTFSEILSLINNTKKDVRDRAAEAVNDILKSNVDIAEAEFNSVLQNKKIDDGLRGMSRPDIGRFVEDDISPEVVDTLIDAVSDNFDVPEDYYKLKANLLGVDKLEYHERNVEYGSIDKDYSFDEACSLIEKVFGDLDEEFAVIFNNFVDKGLVDVFPRKGKRGGAFCAPHFIVNPVYILLNFTEKLRDVNIFAHELGHGINYELMKESQNSLNFETSLATAEVASTFFEDFVNQELMREADDELRLSLMVQKLNDDISSIFRQSAAILFEREIHEKFREKGHLSKEDIGNIFQKHMENYMGEYVEQSEGSENWWVYWPHLRRFFYNYSYSSGLLISKALQRKVRENPESIEEVKKFLSTGTSKSPQEIFSDLGIDITDRSFWENGIQEIKDLVQETRDLAEDLDKI